MKIKLGSVLKQLFTSNYFTVTTVTKLKITKNNEVNKHIVLNSKFVS